MTARSERWLRATCCTQGSKAPSCRCNPRHEAIEGVLAYRRVEDLPVTPDLAVIATPADSVPGLIAELGARGTKAAVVISAGFGEGGDEVGARRLAEMREEARRHDLRVIGPNCLGLMVPGFGINAGFSHIAPRAGDLAFVAQSGAIVTAMLDWATPRGIGFSHVVSLGDTSDVDFADMLDYLAVDPDTRAVLLYVEAIKDARHFMSAARAAARAKPVIVIKGGRHGEGAKAAASHTGALAGSDAVYDAAFARAGMLRVHSLTELADAAETLATRTRIATSPDRKHRLAILTNGGGMGVLATDALIDEGGELAELSPETLAALDRALPATWSRGNPVDVIGDAPAERYAAALEALLGDRGKRRDPGPELSDGRCIFKRRGACRGGGDPETRRSATTGVRRMDWRSSGSRRTSDLREAPDPGLRYARTGGTNDHASGALPPEPGTPARNPALGSRPLHTGYGNRAPHLRGRAGRGAELADRAGGLSGADGLRNTRRRLPASGKPRGSRNARRGGGLSGRPQDPIAGRHAQGPMWVAWSSTLRARMRCGMRRQACLHGSNVSFPGRGSMVSWSSSSTAAQAPMN